MPIQHVALLKLKLTVPTPQQMQIIEHALRVMRSIPEVRMCRGGRPLRIKQEGYNFAVTAELDDWDAFKRYMKHPEHVKLERFLAPLLDGILSYQIHVTEHADHHDDVQPHRDRRHRRIIEPRGQYDGINTGENLMADASDTLVAKL
ncbi:hypothetical protein PUNSTDRAFT_128790 [Punctularia strigosozonata HHB-11173 SS5]|uniref:uncharacterized protein n=1 Tax=Punctularia strigosozonata (strain HHB-11173) TaxID=741275 RepID=UPI0004417908|nr:uncharacterized protein PUNSTDRAFT_128790 [Punctularia strigosozonata HHB-11173 SS5]EIN13108.1 hypothetical protein PUNSTDRAFT_128790 [Punctularia strigosozonata HHB-11173 SS5]